MTQKSTIENLTELDLLKLADNYVNVADILKNYFGYSNRYNTILGDKFKEFDIEFTNYQSRGKKKYKVIIKTCPICFNTFETNKNSPKEKTTCSHGCANTYFRSGDNNANYKDGKSISSYREKCFRIYKKECIICKEDKIVDVHHFDENHSNNDITNLIPLCPTHHRYYHSKYKYLIEDKIIGYKNSR